MKKLFASIMLLSLILLAGCAMPQEASSPTEQYEPYIYHENGENSYITLNVESGSAGSMGSMEAPHVDFSSPAEMREKIKSGNFTKEELKEISRFTKNDQNQILSISAESIYTPTFFKDFNWGELQWNGSSYSYAFSDENSYGYFTMYSNEQAQAGAYSDILGARYISECLNSKKTEDGKGTIYYYHFYTTGHVIVYTITQGDTTYHIAVFHDQDYDMVILYGLNPTQSFRVTWFPSTSNDKFPYEPTLDQLLQFGIKKYVETEIS